MTTNTTINAERIVELSARDGNTVFHHGINNANDLMFLGIYDLHDAYKWYNDHVRSVPHNAIRVIRVAQTEWPPTPMRDSLETTSTPDQRSGLNNRPDDGWVAPIRNTLSVGDSQSK